MCSENEHARLIALLDNNDWKYMFDKRWGRFFKPYKLLLPEACLLPNGYHMVYAHFERVSDALESRLARQEDESIATLVNLFIGPDEFEEYGPNAALDSNLPILVSLLHSRKSKTPNHLDLRARKFSSIEVWRLAELVHIAQKHLALRFFKELDVLKLSFEAVCFNLSLFDKRTHLSILDRSQKIEGVKQYIYQQKFAAPLKEPLRLLQFSSSEACVVFLTRMCQEIDERYCVDIDGKSILTKPTSHVNDIIDFPGDMIRFYSGMAKCYTFLPIIATENTLREILSPFKLVVMGQIVSLTTRVLIRGIDLGDLGVISWWKLTAGRGTMIMPWHRQEFERKVNFMSWNYLKTIRHTTQIEREFKAILFPFLLGISNECTAAELNMQ